MRYEEVLRAAWREAFERTRWEEPYSLPFYRWQFSRLERHLAGAGEFGLLGQHLRAAQRSLPAPPAGDGLYSGDAGRCHGIV